MKNKYILIGFMAFLMLFGSISMNLGPSDSGLGIVERPQVREEFVLSDGEAWLTGWDYRKLISISGETGAGTDYQVVFDIEYGSGSDSGNTIYCSSHSQTDFGDVRFTDNDGDTELDYWLEEFTGSGDATFWVEVADSLESGTVVIYVYYGTSGTSSTTSNGANTFIIYEDWSSQSVRAAVWDTIAGDGSISYSSTDAEQGGYVAKVEGGAGSNAQAYESDYTMVAPNSLMFRAKIEQTLASNQRIRIGSSTPSAFPIIYIDTNAGDRNLDIYDDDGNSDHQAMDAGDFNAWHTFDMIRDGTNAKLYIDSILEETASCAPDTVSDNGIFISVVDSEKDLYLDWLVIRKFVVTEPSVASTGSEEEANSVPVNDVAPACIDLDDIDNMYAEYQEYQITSSVTDANGFADIDYVELSAMNGASVVWTVRFDEDTAVFSEQVNATYITLGTSSNVSSGVNLDIVWEITITWYHEDLDDLDLKQYVVDSSAESDTDTYDLNYDVCVETQILSLDVFDSAGTVTRGTTGGTITSTGTVVYDDNTGITVPDSVDVHIITDGSGSDTTLVSGAFSVSVTASATVKNGTYTVKVVADGTGSGGIDLLVASQSDWYITDEFSVVWDCNAALSDDWFEINVAAKFWITITYKFDSTIMSSGTVRCWDQEENAVIALATYKPYLTYDTVGEYWYETVMESTNYTRDMTTTWDLITGDVHGIVKIEASDIGVSQNLEWDGVEWATGPVYFWVQYSVDAVYLLFGEGSSLERMSDGFDCTENILEYYVNGTINAAFYLPVGEPILEGLAIGPFNTNWYYTNISIQIEIGGDHTYTVFERILLVDILHSIHIEDSDFDLTDNWVTINIQTNWNNATFFVWDNITGTPVYVGAAYEGLYQIAKSSVVGAHDLIVLVNGTHGTLVSTSQVAGTVDMDSWEYLEYTYTVNPITFSITDPYAMQNNVSIIFAAIFYTSDLELDVTIYEDGIYLSTGTLSIPESGSYYVLKWDKSSATSVANWTVKIKSDTTNLSIYGYNFIIDGASYSYLSSGHFEGDDVYIGPSDAAAANISNAAMYDALGNVFLLLAIPVVVGVAVKLDRAKGAPRGKRDKRNDGM